MIRVDECGIFAAAHSVANSVAAGDRGQRPQSEDESSERLAISRCMSYEMQAVYSPTLLPNGPRERAVALDVFERKRTNATGNDGRAAHDTRLTLRVTEKSRQTELGALVIYHDLS